MTEYIRNKLRIRVLGNIEGDDAVKGFARPDQTRSPNPLSWWEYLDKSAELHRQLRGSANSSLHGVAGVTTADVDDHAETLHHAERMRAELEIRKYSGQAGLPWLVVRGHDGTLRAFHNVCSHKAALLVEGTARGDDLRCPYHGWCYRLDGSLRSAPSVAGIRDFDRAAMALRPLAVEVWGPFVFVNA
ncbi:MAG: Rieske (2Fe-2S) protein, partial [bacterium]|nr:Rieske (2Fe-2S) protein [bacterium]